MFNVPVNYIAVLLCGVSNMLLGMAWYGPLFGKEWMALTGVTAKKLEEGKKKGMAKAYSLTFISALVMAYTLAHILYFSGARDLLFAVKMGLWSWVGFVATSSGAEYLFSSEPKPWLLYVLNNGYYAVSLVVMAVILSQLGGY